LTILLNWHIENQILEYLTALKKAKKNCHPSRISVRPTARYHTHTHWAPPLPWPSPR